MVRQAIENRQIEPGKVDEKGHKDGGYTRPLVGDAFQAFAAENLGFAESDLVPKDSAGDESGGGRRTGGDRDGPVAISGCDPGAGSSGARGSGRRRGKESGDKRVRFEMENVHP